MSSCKSHGSHDHTDGNGHITSTCFIYLVSVIMPFCSKLCLLWQILPVYTRITWNHISSFGQASIPQLEVTGCVGVCVFVCVCVWVCVCDNFEYSLLKLKTEIGPNISHIFGGFNSSTLICKINVF